MKYVGIDIGGTNLKAGLIDEFGNILVTRKMKVAGGGGDAELPHELGQRHGHDGLVQDDHERGGHE